MHDVLRQTRECRQGVRAIEISPHRFQTERAQLGEAIAVSRERVQHAAAAHEGKHAQRNVPATDDEQPSHPRILAEGPQPACRTA